MSTTFTNRRFLILGAGITGNAVAHSLKSRGGLVTIADDNSADAVKPASINLSDFDAVVISPGWRQDHPLVAKVLASNLPILNEIDLAWQIRTEVSPHQKWIALTGTNGKTTTVEMVAKILQTAGLKAVACGNVGDTVIEAVDRKDSYDYLILELSSFQLH
jgi:UDP-N-acetylmuramoylalanine--D-glutamate ligase